MCEILNCLLIPPRHCISRNGMFNWPSICKVEGTSELIEHLNPFFPEWRMEPAEKGHIFVRIKPDSKGIDGYSLDITPEKVSIAGASPAAIFYGLQTLREIHAAYGNQIPACHIEDHADFLRRGVYLDCSRGKVPKMETLKQLIDLLATWKINELQLYIENVFSFEQHPDIGAGFSPFTKKDLIELREYCRQRFIRLVGSLASCGHMETILALPEYKDLGELPDFHGYPGGTTLCVTDPRALKLMDELYSEIIPIFDAADFNICGDEPWELGKGRSKKQAEKIGKGQLYAEFISKLHDLVVNKYGKRMNMWGDVVCTHPEAIACLPRDIVMLNWDYSAYGERFDWTYDIRKHGFPTMVCSGTSAWQTHGSRIDNSMKNIAGFAKVGRDAGAEGLLNTDWGDCGHRNPLGSSLHGLAYGGAQAWNGKDVNNLRFTDVFCRQILEDEDASLAAPLRMLGNSSPTSPNALFHGLVTPIWEEHDFTADLEPHSPVLLGKQGKNKLFDEAVTGEIHQVIKGFSDNPFAKHRAASGQTSFAQNNLDDLALAVRLDTIAARRVLIAQRLRAGCSVPPSDCRELAEDMKEMADVFAKNWLLRNRPSRLNDNLHLIKAAAEELRD